MTTVPHDSSNDQPTDMSNTAKASLALAELLTARVCHDLAGALGTLMGALELANEDIELVAEALPVANDAAATLGKRLQMMRVAWGSGGEPIGIAELRNLVSGLQAARRVQISLDGLAADSHFSAPAARLLINLLAVAVESLAGEGVVLVADSLDGQVMIALQGPRAAWPDGFAAQLANTDVALRAIANAGPRFLQAPLTALIAQSSKLKVSMMQMGSKELSTSLIAFLR